MNGLAYRYSPLGAECEFDENELQRLGLKLAFGQPLIVSVPDLSIASIDAVVGLLSEEPALLFADPDNTRVGGDGNPLVLELPDGSRLSDRGFWDLVCSLHPEPLDLIERYVHGALGHIGDGAMLCDRQLGLVGEDALYAYLDRLDHLRVLDWEDNPSELVRYATLFHDYFVTCDLNKEVRQHEHVVRLLEFLRPHPELFARLVAHRMCHGQNQGVSLDVRRWMTWKGTLKRIVDEHLAHVNEAPRPLDIECELCLRTDDGLAFAVHDLIDKVYGSHPARQVVFDYVAQRGGPDLAEYEANLGDYAARSSAGQKLWADRRSPYGDTGFHSAVFGDDQEHRWVVNDEFAANGAASPPLQGQGL